MTPAEPGTPYVRLQPAAPGSSRRLSGGVFFLATLLVVTIVGGLAAVVTLAFHPTPSPRCTFGCAPPRARTAALPAALPDEGSFASSAFGFHVDYRSPWSLQTSGNAGLVLSWAAGWVNIVGIPGAAGAAQLLDQGLSVFQSKQIAGLAEVGIVQGAHVGSEPGQGVLYSGTVTPPSGSGQAAVIRIGIIVARRGSLNVRVAALMPYDQATGSIYAGDVTDYLLTAFRWPGQ